MTSGSVFKTLYRFALPLILSGLLQQMYSICDSIILGNFVGDSALAMVGVTAPLFNIVIYVIIGFVSGYTILLAQMYGAREEQKIHKLTCTVSIMLVLLSLVVLVPGFFLREQMLRLLNTPVEIFGGSEQYLSIMLAGVPFVVLYNLYSSMLRGMGNSKTPMHAIAIASVINIVLDLLFVAVFKWGVAGAAVATLIAQCISAIFLIIYTGARHSMLRVDFKRSSFDNSLFFETVKLGAPRVLQSLFMSGGSMILQRVMNGFGEATVTAITTAYKVDSLTLLPIINISTAISIFTGQNIGAGNISRAKAGLKSGIQLSFGVSVFITALFVCFAPQLMSIFGVSSGVVDLGSRFLRTCAVFYPIMAIFGAYSGFLQGAKDVMFIMIVSIVALCVRIGASYALMPWLTTDVIAVAECMSWTVSFVMYIIRYRTGGWKRFLPGEMAT